MVDLTAAPFRLNQAAIDWVHTTIASMSVEQKIGQLFINHNDEFDAKYLDRIIERYHVGGMRYRAATAADVQAHARYAQSKSPIPLLIAGNPDKGGFGPASDGTLVSTHLQAGSHPDKSIARTLGSIAGTEMRAIGCNWAFAPIVDIHMNWRNTIVATRSFGNNADIVIERAKEFIDGLGESGIASAIKHFPGDGVDERDQHVVTSYNTLEADDWYDSYGRVYRELIAHGAQSIMAGHIGAPALSRKFRPGIPDEKILPATLSPELLQDLLRGELGFNGVIVSDASQMVGLTQSMSRRLLVPSVIAAGCDMFLFFNNHDEDFGYMADGYRDGLITEERLHDALERILGLKASLGLHSALPDDLVPPTEALAVVGSEHHRSLASEIADKTITLIKDTRNALPITPATHPRIRLYTVSGAAGSTRTDPHQWISVVIDELEHAGFAVDLFSNLATRNANGDSLTFMGLIADEMTSDYAERYDAALVVANVDGFAQDGSIRISWSSPMSPEIPWYSTEVPTVFISFNQPNHLIDVPMVGTVVHAHNPSREAIHATVEKITGASPFRGTFNDNVWCDTFGTRL